MHSHTIFPLITTSLSHLGIFFVLRKRARVDFHRREANSTNAHLSDMRTCHANSTHAHLSDMRTITRVKRERKFVTTPFLSLLFLIISLIPYFASILVEANCSGCRGKKWLIVLRESSVVFLFLNSVNPLLTTFRIKELKHSLRIVICVQRQEDVSSFGSSVQQKTMRNTVSV